MGLCAYTVKRNRGGSAMTGIRRHRRLLDSQLFWLSFFYLLGLQRERFLQSHEHGDEEYAGTMVCGDLCACGAVVSGLLQPVRRCPEEALCVDPGGDPDLPDVAVRDHLAMRRQSAYRFRRQ